MDAEADEEKEEEEEREEEDDEYAPKWHPILLITLITLASLPTVVHYMCLLLPLSGSSHGQGF